MRVLLATGSSDARDVTLAVQRYARAVVRRVDLVIEGGADGLDTLVKDLALREGKELIEMPADWARLGRPAGPARNIEMIGKAVSLKLAGARVVAVGFPGPMSRGTWHCLREACSAGLDTFVLQRGRLRRYG